MPGAIDKYIAEQRVDEVRDRRANPITGWPLPILARWDCDGARGLLADLVTAGVLTRQAAFVTAAGLDPNGVPTFLDRLRIDTPGAAGVGSALRSRRARDVIAAIFDVEPTAVPTGYLRALARIEEAHAEKPGLDPFDKPDSYRALFETLSTGHHGRKANALRYCGKIRSSTLHAVAALDPVLVWPEMLAMLGTAKQVRALNALLTRLRGSMSTQDEEVLVTAMRRSLAAKNIVEVFARNLIEHLDHLPAPPIAAQPGLRPLRSVAEYREFGRRFKNCCGDKIAEAALGMIAVYEVTCEAEDGNKVVVAASLTPMIDGQWQVSSIDLPKNKTPPDAVRRDVLHRFMNFGVLVSGPALTGPYQRDLGELLGAYRWAPLDECLRDMDQAEADALDELETALEEHA